MSTHNVPETADKRISELDVLFDEFKQEYKLFNEKQKKVSGHRARKALLSFSKLTRFIRKDIQDVLATMSKTKKVDTNTEA